MTKAPQPPASCFIHRAAKDKENPYFMMRKDTAQDKALSYEARGMLCYFLSKPDTWKVKIHDLILEAIGDKPTKAGKTKVYGILTELAEHGYIKTPTRHKDDKGKWVWSAYEVYERPLPDLPDMDSPDMDQPEMGEPYTGGPETDKPDIKEVSTESVTPEPKNTDPEIIDHKSSSVVPVPMTPPPTPHDDDKKVLQLIEKPMGEGAKEQPVEDRGRPNVHRRWQYLRAGKPAPDKLKLEVAQINADYDDMSETILMKAMDDAEEKARQTGEPIYSWNFVRRFYPSPAEIDRLKNANNPARFVKGRYAAFINTPPADDEQEGLTA